MSINIKVVTLKGQTLDKLSVTTTTTVRDLKYQISSRMNGQQVREMKLVFKAKPLTNTMEEKTLGSLGMRADGSTNHVHVVSRFEGGMPGGHERTPVQEIAYQLKFVRSGKLHCVELIEPEDEWTWNIMMRGPKRTPYDKGLFSVTFSFPPNYPYGAPTIKFNTPIFHPNVWENGSVCWHDSDTSGTKYFADVLIGAVNCLLEEPNPNSPANPEAARLYASDRSSFNRYAKEMTKQHAWGL